MNKRIKVLFITKKNESYGQYGCGLIGSGLFTSTNFVAESLRQKNIDATVVEVADNNNIDNVVFNFKPDIVIIEALWVVPEKFDILKSLYPKIKWFIHLHSNIPFLAIEGIATDWIQKYLTKGIGILCNSKKSFQALFSLFGVGIYYLPNVYLGELQKPKVGVKKDHIDIGCFGAVRPMKNQLIQAMAAIEFCIFIGKPLRFHINATRVETGGEPVIKNIRALFKGRENAELIENTWHSHHSFLKHLRHLDMCLQVSLSETFNIVTADCVNTGLPVVVSSEIDWVSKCCVASTDDIESIVGKMRHVFHKSYLVRWNQRLLKKHSKIAVRLWFDFVLDQLE